MSALLRQSHRRLYYRMYTLWPDGFARLGPFRTYVPGVLYLVCLGAWLSIVWVAGQRKWWLAAGLLLLAVVPVVVLAARPPDDALPPPIRIGNERPPATEKLLRDLASAPERYRITAACGLAERPSEAHLIVPIVAQELDASRDPRTRRALLWTVRRLGPAAAGATGSVTRALGDARAGVSDDVLVALAAIGERAASAVPALLAALDEPPLPRRVDEDENWWMRMHEGRQSMILRALEAIGGPDAKAAAPRLLEGMRRGDYPAKRASLFGALGSQDSAVAAFMLDLRASDAERRRRAAEALGSLAKNDPDVRGALQGASDDPNERVKWAAKYALDPEYSGD